MKKIAELIVKHKTLILIISLLLVIPSIIGYIKTDVNYDILTYLPKDIETLKGENILTDDFKSGAFSIVITENMSVKDIIELEKEIREINTVEKVISVSDLTGTGIPISMFPDSIRDKFAKDDTELILVTYSGSTSDKNTLSAVEEIRKITKDKAIVGGMSTMVLDTKEIFNSEMLLYVVIAVIFCILVLELSLDSYLVPFILIANIAMAVLYNMGSNIMFGNICYITKAIVAILQLGVTTDFSIFLYHKYERLKKEETSKEKAMALAIKDTFTSVLGSSLTTIAGFLALCTMELTLGVDIGLVMAKGVLIGVICVLTLFPALLLVFDKQIEKTKHKVILPEFKLVKEFVFKHYKIIFAVFLILLIPAYFAQSKTEVYYKLDKSIPDEYGYKISTKALKDKYDLVTQEMILINKDIPPYKINEMIEEIEKLDGMDFILSSTKLTNMGITENMIPENIRNVYMTDKYRMIILGSKYEVATDELNEQSDKINEIIKKYDKDSILAGEGPLTKDLIKITKTDFVNVNYTSIGVIFVLMLLVLKSASLPVLLVTTIEFAIFINMGVPYFTGTEIPFVASIVLGTIQLGATIDYAILMTTKYLEEREKGIEKKKAVKTALDSSTQSIFVSAMCFFAATIGVGIISRIDMIGSLCRLISRGALISMLVVILLIPSILIIFDKLIIHTTLLKKEGKKNMKNKMKKTVAALLILAILSPVTSLALTKEETVYSKLDASGNVKQTIVNEHLINDKNETKLTDKTDLNDIININSDKTFSLNNKLITWNADGKDIFFQGKTTKNLPITEKVTYKLNGKEIALTDLLGKSGTVEIIIKHINNSKKAMNIDGKMEELYTPFVVATITNFSNSNASNVTVTNGKVVDNGIGYSIVALTVPGLYNSLKLKELDGLDTITIKLNTTKFSLPSIYSVATPKIIDTSDYDIFTKLNNMYANINRLQNAMNELEIGSKTILANLNKISDGTSKIAENLSLVVTNLEKIKNGTVELDNGLTQIVNSLSESKEDFDKMNSKLAEMNELIKANTSYINGLNNIKTNYEQLASYPEEALSPEQLHTKALLKFSYDNFNLGDQSKSLITVLTLNNKALNETIEAFKKVNTAMTQLNTYLPKLKEGANTLSTGTAKLKEGVALLSEKTNTLSDGAKKINEGMGKLNSGISKFNNQGIKPIVKVGNDAKKLTKRIEALDKLSNGYDSFSLKKDDTKSNTKFIMVIDGKEAPKEENKEVKKETKKQGLLERIAHLFD